MLNGRSTNRAPGAGPEGLQWLWWAGPLAWVAGVAVQLQQPALWSGHVYQLFCALALSVVGLFASFVVGFRAGQGARRWWWGIGLCVGVAVLGAASTGWRAAVRQQQVLAAPWEGTVSGRVSDLPRATPSGWRLEFELDGEPPQPADPLAGAPPGPARWPAKVMLSWQALDAGGLPQAGERWRLPVRLREPHGNLNPHGFDTELWMWSQGLGASGSVRLGPRDPLAQRLAPAPWGLLALRSHLRTQLHQRVPDARAAGVLAALVVGDQAAIERADWAVFRTTGVAHLFSISGLHITLWAWLVRGLVRWLWRVLPRALPVWGTRVLLACPAPVAAAWGGWWLALAYAVFSGWGVPAQRTVLMLGVVMGLGLLGRRWPWPVVGGVTMAVVLAWDPWAWLQPGFWLSFVAVGVLLAGDRPTSERGAWASVREAARTQWRMTLALAPLTLALFGQLSGVGLLANAVAIPVVTLVVTPLALAGALWAGAWPAAAWVLGGLLAGLQWLAAWPWASLTLPAAPWGLAFLAVVGGLVAVLSLPWPMRCLGAVCMLPVLWWQPQRPVHGEFEVLAVDVGQGSGVLIRTAHGSVLYDAGPQWGPDTDAGQRVLVPLLQSLGEQPSRLVLSHKDNDHVGGALAVIAHLRHAQPPQVWASFEPPALVSGLTDPQLARPWLDPNAQVRPLAWTRCEAGQAWAQDGVRFEVLHPTPELYQRPTSTNNLSCVLWVRGVSGAALLSGDMDATHEAALVARHPGVRADWLLAPHHGSRTASSEAFLRAVRPTWVLAQAGHHNRYGHPAPEVVARYGELGLHWTASPACGAARWRSDQPTALFCHRQEQPRYWRWAQTGP